MKVIKIIGLVNNVYNDFQIPNKIKYKNEIYLWNEEDQWFVTLDNTTLFRIDQNKLNDEVEIIEEEKDIEELPPYVSTANLLKEVTMNRNKINEIVRKLKESK